MSERPSELPKTRADAWERLRQRVNIVRTLLKQDELETEDRQHTALALADLVFAAYSAAAAADVNLEAAARARHAAGDGPIDLSRVLSTHAPQGVIAWET